MEEADARPAWVFGKTESPGRLVAQRAPVQTLTASDPRTDSLPMKDSRILSSFQELAHAAGARPIAEMPEHLRARVQVFDTCQVGTVLRAVLFVQAIVVVAALFGAHSFVAWITQMAIYTGAALPAVLAWLLTVCGLKRQLGLLPMAGQWSAAIGFGALSGLYGCALLVWMGLAEHYLAIEQVRFGERLRVEWSVDETASKAKLPPLILQPLVENAVKHGVEPSASGAVVRISTQRRGGVVVIKVTNTVPAGSGRRGNGLALDNVRQRLTLLHDVQGRFQSALVNGVFQVRLEIPV